MLWEGEFTLVDGLEESRFTATVLTEETVAATVVDFEGGVVEQHFTVEDEGCGGNLDISAGGERRKHTGRHSVRDTVLVLLQLELSDLVVDDLVTRVVQLLSVSVDELVVVVAIAVDRRSLGRILRGDPGGRSLLCGLAVGLTLCLACCFGCGNHFVIKAR